MKESRAKLKSYFQTGDQPTEQEFVNWFDSTVMTSGSNSITGSLIISGSPNDNADGTPVMLHVMGNITSSGNISASGTIYANNFQSTGGDVAGISFTDDLVLTGHLTASGNISASGNIYSTKAFVRDGSSGGIIFDDDGGGSADASITHTGGGINLFAYGTNPASTTHLFVTQSGGAGMAYGKVGICTMTPSEQLEVVGNISASGTVTANEANITGHITASGDISSSGTGIFNRLDVAEYIYHKDDNTYIRFLDDRIVGVAGNNQVLNLNIATDSLEFGHTGKNATIQGSTVTLAGNVTASGNISSSLASTGSFGRVESTTFSTTTLTATHGEFSTINTTQITSSIVTASVIYSSGSNIFGDASDDTHLFNGSITASGNISASGTLHTFGGTIRVGTNPTYTLADIGPVGGDVAGLMIGYDSTLSSISYGKDSDNKHLFYGQALEAQGNISASGYFSTETNITASGNISASGNLIANEITASNIMLRDGANISSDHNQTLLSLNGDDSWTFHANNSDPAMLISNGGVRINSSHVATLDFRVDGTHGDVFVVDAGDDFVEVSGSLKVTGHGHITASGNISASGTITALNFTGSLLGTASTASYVTTAQTASYVTTAQTASYVTTAQTASYVTTAQTASYVTTAQTASYITTAQTASYVTTAQTASYVSADNIDQPFTNITSSGNISSSGLLYASSSEGNYSDVVVQDTSTGRFYTTSSVAIGTTDTFKLTGVRTGDGFIDGHITASGNISASGNLIAQYVTASGNISASGDIYTDVLYSNNIVTLKYSNAESALKIGTDDGSNPMLLQGNITASSNISASGNIYSANHEVIWQCSVTTDSDGTNWYGPNKDGLHNSNWNNTYGDNIGVLTLPHGYEVAGIVVPYNCKLVGFHAITSPLSIDEVELALYYLSNSSSTYNVTSGSSAEDTISSVCNAVSQAPGGGENPMIFSTIIGNGEVMAAGDMLYPRVKGGGSSGANLTFTVLVQRLK